MSELTKIRKLNKLVKLEKERGVSPFARMKHTPLPTLLKILENISPKLDLSKVERIEYKIWDEIGERIYWLCDTRNQFNRIIDLFDLPLYLRCNQNMRIYKQLRAFMLGLFYST